MITLQELRPLLLSFGFNPDRIDDKTTVWLLKNSEIVNALLDQVSNGMEDEEDAPSFVFQSLWKAKK